MKRLAVYTLIIILSLLFCQAIPATTVMADPVDEYSEAYQGEQSAAFQERLGESSEKERGVVAQFERNRKVAVLKYYRDAKHMDMDFSASSAKSADLLGEKMSGQEEAYIESQYGLSRSSDDASKNLKDMIAEKSSSASSQHKEKFRESTKVYQEKATAKVAEYDSRSQEKYDSYNKYSETEMKNGIDYLKNVASTALAAGAVPGIPGSGKGADAVRVAMKYLGLPYVWGGTTPSGFDCSGLMQYAYGQVGVSIPRVTYDQVNAGVEVPRGQEQPGDLVIFNTSKESNGHVGMYIGGGNYVHAPYTGEVIKIASLSSRTPSHIRRVA